MKKKNFWLYHGTVLVCGVNMNVIATPLEVINHALILHDKAPCASSLYPDYSPGAIRGMILNSQVRE